MSNKLRNAKYLLQAIFADILPQDPGDLDETKYVFIHIPKTAGTSFMMMLYEHIPAGKIYPNPKEYFINNKGNYPSLQQLLNRKQSADILRKRKWLAGHFKYQSACALVPNAFLITFLRDPFDRVVSEIVHIKTNHKIHRARSIEAIITKRLKIMGTMQALTFGYLPRKDNLKQAIDNLGTCQFIG
ncbi:MAG: sulfotransferase family protein, partial [Saprospiraceae bacterium]|nr:sulfotransferase family protein [Saprospiraceae bacterium]